MKLRRWSAALGLALSLPLAASLSLAAGSGSARAQEPARQEAQEDAAESRSATFQAVEGPQKEKVPGGPLLVYAYAFVLLSLVAYVARLSSLSAKNRGEIARLAQVLERGRGAERSEKG